MFVKKSFCLSIVFLTVLVVAGCVKSSVSAEQCGAIKSIIQQKVSVINNDSSGTLWAIMQSDIFYSPQNHACYRWQIKEIGGVRQYAISRIAISWNGHKYKVLDDRSNISNPAFEASCILNEQMLSDLTWDILEQTKKAKLCVYVADVFLRRYNELMSELTSQ